MACLLPLLRRSYLDAAMVFRRLRQPTKIKTRPNTAGFSLPASCSNTLRAPAGFTPMKIPAATSPSPNAMHSKSSTPPTKVFIRIPLSLSGSAGTIAKRPKMHK